MTDETMNVAVMLDAFQQYGADKALEAMADALLADCPDLVTFRLNVQGPDGRDAMRFGELEADTVCTDALAGVSPTDVGRFMASPPLGLPAHTPPSRFTWAQGEGGYAPPRFSRDGMRVYRTLGTVKQMRLAQLGESMRADMVEGDGLDLLLLGRLPRHHTVIRRRVNRLMGTPAIREVMPSDKRTAHHAGAVKGKRRTAAEIARIDITAGAANTPSSEGLHLDTDRLERLARAMAVGSGSWAERVDA